MMFIKLIVLFFGAIFCSAVPLQGRSWQLKPRIIGKNLAAQGQFSYFISFRTNDYDGVFHECGGAIISENFILLAAHCINRNKPLSNYEVAVGANHDEVYKVKAIYVHEYYVSSILMNDIALVELTTPINFSSTVQPIQLNRDSIEGGVDGIVVGFDKTDKNKLKYIQLRTITNDECRERYIDRKMPISNSLCASSIVPETGLCTGDSGGPFVVNDSDGKPTIAGIVSWGFCGTSFPSGFTRISEYIEWIDTTMTVANAQS